jgi:hypothetical protein
LYASALAVALEKQDKLQVAYIATQSAQFLAAKRNDPSASLKVYSQAIANPECCSK